MTNTDSYESVSRSTKEKPLWVQQLTSYRKQQSFHRVNILLTIVGAIVSNAAAVYGISYAIIWTIGIYFLMVMCIIHLAYVEGRVNQIIDDVIDKS